MVNVIGLGYIGLPTALMLSKNKVDVVGTDYNKELIDKLNNGEVTFEEEGLVELFEMARNHGIHFSSEYQKTDMYIIAVPTPYEPINKKIDPKYILSAINRVLDVCLKGTIIIIESTISPGSIDRYVKPLIENRGFKIGIDVHLVHAPERIIPGKMIHELIFNSRTIGTDSVEIGLKVKKLYSSFCKSEIVITGIKTAEMSKVVENTYRDVNIAFANELAKICREDNMDVYEIIRIANMHPRVNILSPGPGVGGHCISVDPWFLVGDYPDLTNLILSARKVNDSMPDFVLKRIKTIMDENLISTIDKIGLYGMTYKENVDDTRESPTLQLIEKMSDHLATGIKVYDPFVKQKLVETQIEDFKTFLDSVNIVVIMVAHDHIIENMGMLSDKIVLDTKNVCSLKGVYKL